MFSRIWPTVYTVKVTSKGSRVDEVAKRRYIDAELDGDSSRYRESGRFRQEILTPIKFRGEPVEVSVDEQPPYLMDKHRKGGLREGHATKSFLVRRVNAALDAQADDVPHVHGKDFATLVFVRKRRATFTEALRHLSPRT